MAYSMDLRTRVVQAYEQGEGTQVEIARLFNLGLATVKRWIWRKAATGTPARLPRGGGNPRRIGTIGETVLLGILERMPDATLAELSEEYAWTAHMPMNASVISHTLGRLGITRKKRPYFPVSEIQREFKHYIESSSKQPRRYHRMI